MEGNVSNNQTKLNMSFHDKKPNDKFHEILPIACTPFPPRLIYLCICGILHFLPPCINPLRAYSSLMHVSDLQKMFFSIFYL